MHIEVTNWNDGRLVRRQYVHTERLTRPTRTYGLRELALIAQEQGELLVEVESDEDLSIDDADIIEVLDL